MASELNIDLGPSRNGLTVTATLVLAGQTVGSPVTLTENPTGYYSGNMPSVAFGSYGVRFLSAGALVGTGSILWDGNAERTALNLATASSVAAIPTNPLLTNDARLNDLASILEDTGTTLPSLIADVPTVAEFNARSLPSENYFNPLTDLVKIDTTNYPIIN